jgi:hypothetical protein
MGMVLLLCMMGPPPRWRAHLQSIQEPLPSEQSPPCCIRSDGEAGARMLRVFELFAVVVVVAVEFAGAVVV